jgi:DNA-binding XRE family transcriptional regulator
MGFPNECEAAKPNPFPAASSDLSILRSFYKWKGLWTGSVSTVPRARYDTSPPELARLGTALKALREERGLKQIEAASGADMTESQVSDIERGKNNPGWLLLIRLLVDGLNADLHDLAAAYEDAGKKETA